MIARSSHVTTGALAILFMRPIFPVQRNIASEHTMIWRSLFRTRTWYCKRAAKVLPAAKDLRWAPLENRLDIGLRLQLAGQIPLVPAVSKKP
jgi:hypothetical protein